MLFTKEELDEKDCVNYDDIIMEITSLLHDRKLRIYQMENIIKTVQERIYMFKVI